MKFDQNRLSGKEITHQLEVKIKDGLALVYGAKILHTAPHHDDIVLSYHSYVMKTLLHKSNDNHILYATSGSNGVTDGFVLESALKMNRSLVQAAMNLSYQQILDQFAQAYHDRNDEQLLMNKMFIFAQIIADVFDCLQSCDVMDKINWLINVCFASKKTWQKDSLIIAQLKGRIRESESDCKWKISSGDIHNLTHFRSEFYHADDFAKTSLSMQADVQRLVHYLDDLQPTIITVALDPCGIGPKNHYTTLQLVAAAIGQWRKQSKVKHDITILGYRNVWSNFSLDQASMIIPVTQHEIDQMQSIFVHCFSTQKTTLFVGTEIDGTFSEQVEQLQKIQLQQVATLCDKDFMDQAVLDALRDSAGAIFLQVLTVDQLLQVVNL